MSLHGYNKYALIMVFVCTLFISRAESLSEGYVLCGAYAGRSTILVDKEGVIVHTWKHDSLTDVLNGYSCYLLENGNLLRTAQVATAPKIPGAMPWQGAINEIDPWGKQVWRYVLSNDTFTLHHDMKPMPGGNVLATSFMVQTKSEMIAAGVDTNLIRNPGSGKFILSEKIIEIKPTLPEGGDIVWEWLMFDHVVAKEHAAEHPECISGSIVKALYNQTQWVHLNGLDFCPSADLIVFSSRVFSELYVIDHGTTTQEAAGHTGGRRGKGGDILYRWGNPANYGASGGTTVNCLHSPTWIPEGYPGGGNLLFFHNNAGLMGGPGGGSQSQVIEIKPPMDESGNFERSAGQLFGPSGPTWIFAPADSFCSPFMSSAMRMPNGNTLAHESYPQGNVMDSSAASVVSEITPEGQVVWRYPLKIRSGMEEGLVGGKQSYNPAKIMYYPPDYKGIGNLFSRLKETRIKEVPSINGAGMPTVSVNRRANSIDFLDVAGCKIEIYLLKGNRIASMSPRTHRCRLSMRRCNGGIRLIRIDAGHRGVVNEAIMIH